MEKKEEFLIVFFFSKTLILLINVELMKELFIHYFADFKSNWFRGKISKGVKFLLRTTTSIFLSITGVIMNEWRGRYFIAHKSVRHF